MAENYHDAIRRDLVRKLTQEMADKSLNAMQLGRDAGLSQQAMISIYAEALADNAATLAMAMAVYSDEPVGKALEIVIAHIRDNFYALNRDGRMAAAAAQKAALLRR